MTSHALGHIAMRVMGIYCIIEALRHIAALPFVFLSLYSLHSLHAFLSIAPALVPPLALLGFAYFLFSCPGRILKTLPLPEEDGKTSCALTAPAIHTVGISLAGIFCIADAIPGFGQLLSLTLMSSRRPVSTMDLNKSFWCTLIISLIEAILGILFIMYASTITNICLNREFTEVADTGEE